MSKLRFLLFLSGIILLGCKTQKQPTQSASADCVGFIDIVKGNWTFDKGNNYYVVGDELQKILSDSLKSTKFYHCIQTWDTAQLFNTFGNPNVRQGNSATYAIKPIGRATTFQFIYNKQGVVTTMYRLEPID